MVTLFDWTCIFEWYMTRFVVKNGHSQDTCYYEIGLRAQNLDTILSSKSNNTIGSEGVCNC